MKACNIIDKPCIFVNFGWNHNDACEYTYANSEVDLFLWVNWGFGLHWACKLLMKTCNVLDKICTKNGFGAWLGKWIKTIVCIIKT